MRSFLVGSNKARIAGDIGCKNGDELPFDLMHGYGVRRHGLSLRKGEEPYHGPCFLPKDFGAPTPDRMWPAVEVTSVPNKGRVQKPERGRLQVRLRRY